MNEASGRLQGMTIADHADAAAVGEPVAVTHGDRGGASGPDPTAVGGRRVIGALSRPAVAAVLLLLVYVGLSFANDPNGYLGTDTGGKVATLQAMEQRGSVGGLDVGYWAERWDPDGDLHGFWSTNRSDDGNWVQVSTVPLVLTARPLWEAGGYRLALLLPMLGGVACALAARALARRIGGSRSEEMTAFWLVGVAGPVLIYALDLWEHTLGLAAMAWATVLAIDAFGDGDVLEREEPGSHARALLAVGAGLLWGVGFSMRTEALLYGAVITAALCLAVVRRRPVTAVVNGAATALGLAVGFFANAALERTVLGGALRAGRASKTAEGFGSEASARLKEGLMTSVGVDGSDAGILFGAVAVVALAVLIRRSVWAGWHRDRIVVVLGVLATVPVVLVLARRGLGFVPGMLIASPVAVAGLAVGARAGRRAKLLVFVAGGSLPLVWAFQYMGGAAPQWGGRYVLLSALLLTVAGVVGLRWADPMVRRSVVAVAVAVTALGFGWMVVRTHGFASAGADIAAADEPVLIARDATGFLPREFVAANEGQRWLATLGEDELERAVEIVEEAGFDRFGLLVVDGRSAPERLGGMERVEVVTIPLVSGVEIEIVRYAS